MERDPEQPLVVLVSVGSAESARSLSSALIERGLAGCVSAVPGLLSTYRWKGEITTDEEHLLIIKTMARRLEALEEAIVELHEYDVPEILALPVQSGRGDYLRWLSESVGP